MSILTIALLCVAGGAGACARLILDGWIRQRTTMAFPLGTTVINVSGSLLLGLVTALTVTHSLPAEWQAIAGVGFLGGYTTFSTASFETVRLLQNARYVAAAVNGVGMLLLSVAAAAAGFWLGSL